MRDRSLSWSVFFSLILHIILAAVFIFSFDRVAPLTVFENTNQQDVISAVILGDQVKSHIIPDVKPLPPQPNRKPEPEKPPEKSPEKPVVEEPPLKPKEVAPKADEPSKVKDALPLETKKKRDLPKKVVEPKPDLKSVFGKDLLSDIRDTVKKQRKKEDIQAKAKFAKTLKAQAEASLRQHVFQEDIRLSANEARFSQGVVDKYKALIIQAISQEWRIPPGTNKKLSSELLIRLSPSGEVLHVAVRRSSGDVALDRSARAAVLKASPLPVPKDAAEFAPFREFTLKVRPETVQNI